MINKDVTGKLIIKRNKWETSSLGVWVASVNAKLQKRQKLNIKLCLVMFWDFRRANIKRQRKLDWPDKWAQKDLQIWLWMRYHIFISHSGSILWKWHFELKDKNDREELWVAYYRKNISNISDGILKVPNPQDNIKKKRFTKNCIVKNVKAQKSSESSQKSQNCRITEWLRLEETSGGHIFHTHCSSRAT